MSSSQPNRRTLDKQKLDNVVILGSIPKKATNSQMITLLSPYGNLSCVELFSIPPYPIQNEDNYNLLTRDKSYYCLANYITKESLAKIQTVKIKYRWEKQLIVDHVHLHVNETDNLIEAINSSDNVRTLTSTLEEEENIPDHKRSKFSESDPVPIMKQILWHLHLAFELGQYSTCKQLVEYFFQLYSSMPKVKLNITKPKTLLKFMGKEKFKVYRLLDQANDFQASIFKILQHVYWVMVISNLKLSTHVDLIKFFNLYMVYYFRGVKFHELDDVSSLLIQSIWRIKFVNQNYKYVEDKIDQSNSLVQHWVVMLISKLQASYYEVAKCHYEFYEDYDDLFDRFDQYYSEYEQKPVIQWKSYEKNRGKFNISELFSKQKDEVIKILIMCTTNLLNHKFHENHPRRFVSEYIRSMKMLLSLNGHRAFVFAGEWIEKKQDRLAFSQKFPSIFRVIVFLRSIYQIMKKDIEACTLNLMDFLTYSIKTNAVDYDFAVKVFL